MPKIKIFIIALSLILLTLIRTKNTQNAYIDTKLMQIPISCLDANKDGYYNKLDFNYGGINIYESDQSAFNLMDKKGAAFEIRKCEYQPPNNINIKYLSDTDCVNYCRLKVWIKSKI